MVDGKLDKALCMALKEAISDERAAPPMYEKLRAMLSDSGILTSENESRINRIIKDEEDHEKFFKELAEEKGCQLSTVKESRKLYADLPLVERIRLAKEHVPKMEEIYGV